jgi:hypothetical protein
MIAQERTREWALEPAVGQLVISFLLKVCEMFLNISVSDIASQFHTGI